MFPGDGEEGTGVPGAGEEGSCVTEIGVDVLATSMMTEKVGAVATNWAAAVPDSVRVTVFVLDVVDIVVTEIVFAALSPDAHVRIISILNKKRESPSEKSKLNQTNNKLKLHSRFVKKTRT